MSAFARSFKNLKDVKTGGRGVCAGLTRLLTYFLFCSQVEEGKQEVPGASSAVTAERPEVDSAESAEPLEAASDVSAEA